ncbi:hypothetical protein BJ165DRAFT_1532619 [Panaeolus papilionaceus]|nr:hypothetical protein BJ165DRAFT_1532619 [Panaeolus papilionaceus]
MNRQIPHPHSSSPRSTPVSKQSSNLPFRSLQTNSCWRSYSQTPTHSDTDRESEAEISVCASYHSQSGLSVVTVPTSLYLDEPASPPTSLHLIRPNPASELNDPTPASRGMIRAEARHRP